MERQHGPVRSRRETAGNPHFAVGPARAEGRPEMEAVMENATRQLTEHPYLILFLAVLAEQIGLPLPAGVFLLAGGSLAALGTANLGALLLTGIAATLLGDIVWFAAGRRRGRSVMDFLLRFVPGPEATARRAWDAFKRRGDRILLWAKFVPGLSTFTTPLAGAAQMSLPRFLAFDGAGALLWSGGYLALGFILGPEVGRFSETLPELKGSPGLLLLMAGLTLVAWKHVKSHRANTLDAMVPVRALTQSRAR
jgi:membrane protein DedA with SNARE-associated domain